MAIAKDALIFFFNIQVEQTSSPALVANGAFSVADDTKLETFADDAPESVAVLKANFTTAPDADSVIDLHLRPMNIEGGNDGEIPDANNLQYYVGSFVLRAITGEQRIQIDYPVRSGKSSAVYEAYIQNKSGQELPATWQLWFSARTVGPHP